MIELPIVNNNEIPSICTECGGKCCKGYAGWYHPEQVLEILKVYKDTNELPDDIKIDAWDGWDGNPSIYVLRPAHTNSGSGLFDLSWGGTCVNHNDETGCSLSFEDRPMQCQDLKAGATLNDSCISEKWGKEGLMNEWIDYQSYFKE